MEASIDAECVGTNSQEDHLIRLGEFFAVCKENHTQFKEEKCEAMQETMQYLFYTFPPLHPPVARGDHAVLGV